MCSIIGLLRQVKRSRLKVAVLKPTYRRRSETALWQFHGRKTGPTSPVGPANSAMPRAILDYFGIADFHQGTGRATRGQVCHAH